ncbi:IS4 family transposase [Vibrio sp. TRT 29B02]|uniref:IS4 family transposase n=1 Tax=Vibrio sp. TRT 29B02 TaxID=3418508 RepID=UPI003CF8884F
MTLSDQQFITTINMSSPRNVMNVKSIVSNFLNAVLGSMHKTRARAFGACVESVLSGNALYVTSIGRGIVTQAYEKHAIKRADRLLSNSHLYESRLLVYKRMTTLLTSHLTQPVIHVDWSDLNKQKTLFLLRASLSFKGRALTLYEEVHPLETKEKATTHNDFLNRLKILLPTTCTPIIVTDAGFKRPWFKSVTSHGWHFVGRVRGKVCLSPDGNQGEWCKALFPRSTSTPTLMKNWFMGNKLPYRVNLILYKAKSKGRIAKTTKGLRQQSNYSRKNARRANDPWVLVTSLPARLELAKRVVNIYSNRMQIEESFRDCKSERFGLGMSSHGTKRLKRMSILVLIASVGHLLLTLIGLLGERMNAHCRFQANTIKTRAVLSYFYLGMRLYKRPGWNVAVKEWRKGIESFLIKLAKAQEATI